MRLHAPRATRASRLVRNGPRLSPLPLPYPSRSRCIHVPVPPTCTLPLSTAALPVSQCLNASWAHEGTQKWCPGARFRSESDIRDCKFRIEKRDCNPLGEYCPSTSRCRQQPSNTSGRYSLHFALHSRFRASRHSALAVREFDSARDARSSQEDIRGRSGVQNGHHRSQYGNYWWSLGTRISQLRGSRPSARNDSSIHGDPSLPEG